ncbi:MAG: hypoxanthine phosphoribosyltransferase [Deltaproteobacteria bacterium GWC2_42_11]|nr:MAG: hypoxanthine phosphoribosyltransferase [Deltaproteobacteria bacterium GWC2_42_11]HBO85261.1 hypoxanthine phosphoribosyltransferase [Deltaproteobacteria bacterium]
MQISRLKPVISDDEIKTAVKKLADEIRRDYLDKHPVLIGILKGSFMFLSDLIKELDAPVKIDFIRAASYGSDDYSSGKVMLTKDIDMSIKGMDVLVVEDIVDTGYTLQFIINRIKTQMPSSIKVCSLMDRPEKRTAAVKVDYAGFRLNKDVGFVVGYGLDYNEDYRYLHGIYEMVT